MKVALCIISSFFGLLVVLLIAGIISGHVHIGKHVGIPSADCTVKTP